MNIDKLCELCFKYSSTKTKLKNRNADLDWVKTSWQEKSKGIIDKKREIEGLEIDLNKAYNDILNEVVELKQLLITDVVVPKGTLCECECEYPIIRQDLTEYCSICQKEVK